MNIEKKSIVANILPFLPLLVLYIIMIFFFSADPFGDEPRYIQYATNMTNGFYADADNPSLRNGPGYPLFITLPVLLNASDTIIRLLNVPLLLMALVFLYKSLTFFLKPRKAILLCYIVGLYPSLLKCLMRVLSESLALFLICGFLYFFLKLYNEASHKNRNLILSASFLGLLALTKVIFGYVILFGILGSSLTYVFTKSKKIRSSLLVLVISFAFCIPFLGYTYSVTGKPFLWGTHGGEMLYWRSTPFVNEYGNWISSDAVLGNNMTDENGKNELYKNHRPFIESLAPLSHLERDARFKEKAIQNMKENPIKYLKNTGASAVRLFFNYPFSNTPQKMSTYVYILPNMFLVVFLLLAIVLARANRKAMPFEVLIIIFMTFIFLGGLTLLNGKVRHLLPSLPLLLFFISYVFQKFIKIKNGAQIEINRN